MPISGLLSCSVEIGESTTRLREYGTTYSDRTVETYVAIPTKPTPFSIRVKSTGYIAPGLAVYVYIDSVYQTNRNKRGATRENSELEFHLGQKEDLLRDGRVIARGWWFEKLNIVEGKTEPTINEEVLGNLGVIEVVILRCEDDPASIPRNPWTFPILPSIPPPARKVSSTGAAPKQSKRKLQAPFQEAEDNGDDALDGMFGLFDGAGDEPPRKSRRHFGDIADWSASVAPHSLTRKHRSHGPEVADDATRTSTVSSNGYYHMPVAFNHFDSNEATYGAERDPADQYRSRIVYIRSKKGIRDDHYDSRERRQTRFALSPEPRAERAHCQEGFVNSPQRRHVEPPLESPPQYDRRDKADRRFSRNANDDNTLPAPAIRHRKKVVEIGDDVDHDQEPVFHGRRDMNERVDCQYVAPGNKTSGESYHVPLAGDLKHEHELKYPAVDIPSPYGRANVGYELKYLAARDARRREPESNAQLQPPPWQSSIPQPPPSHPARYIVKERADLVDTGWRPPRSLSGPLHPAHRDMLFHPPAPLPSYVGSALVKPSNKTRRTAKKIAKLEEQLHKLRADNAPLHHSYSNYPLDWRQGGAAPGNRVMYGQPSPFGFPWPSGYTTRTHRSSSTSSGTTRSAIDDVGEVGKKESIEEAAKAGAGNSNNAPNNNDNSNSSNQNGATSGWGQDTDNNNPSDGNQANNSNWEDQNKQNDSNQQQSGWGTTDNQNNENNAGGNNGWGNTPNTNDQQQDDNNKWNNNQDDNNQVNNNGDNGWDNQQNDQNKGCESEKSKNQRNHPDATRFERAAEKPYTRSYWYAQVSTYRSQDRANSGRKRETFTMPEDPIYTISKDEAEAKRLMHQVRGGRGTEKQNKLGTKPLYWDNLEAPFAVFRFKYRSKDMLKKILGEDVKENKEEYKEWLNALSKEQLVAEMLRKKEEGDSDSEKRGEDKKIDGQAQDGNTGWDNSNNNGGTGDWNNSGGGGNNCGGDSGGGGWGASGGDDVAPLKSGW